MSEESNPAEERLERLARDFLGEYQQDDALAALAEIAKVAPPDASDDVLVEAARHWLDAGTGNVILVPGFPKFFGRWPRFGYARLRRPTKR